MIGPLRHRNAILSPPAMILGRPHDTLHYDFIGDTRPISIGKCGT
jgi:hypothetical protein